MKKLFIIGTSAEFIKIAPVLKLMPSATYAVWSTDQQFEAVNEASAEFGIPLDFRFGTAATKKPSNFLSGFVWATKICVKLLIKLLNFREIEIPLIVVHGDTTTSFLAAMVARLVGAPVAHIEAGFRSGNLLKPFPEEINRRFTARLASVHYAPTLDAVGNLKGRKGEILFTHGNTAIDALVLAKSGSSLKFELPEEFALVFLHRAELLNNRKIFIQTLNELIELSAKKNVVFILDPLTDSHIRKYEYLEKMKRVGILFQPKLSYSDFHFVLSMCDFLITDSGGQQQEVSHLGIPTLIHRSVTEDTSQLGALMKLSHLRSGAILDFSDKFQKRPKRKVKLLESPSRIIASHLQNL